MLKPQGLASIEFPHLLRLLLGNQFDTIYHEHYSYLSLKVVRRIANAFGLEVVDVQQLPTHGGSLRVWLAHRGAVEPKSVVNAVLADEIAAGLESFSAYKNFQFQSEAIKHTLVEFLLEAKRNGELVLGYGAAAKGNTLLNYAGIQSDLLSAVADRAISKQNKYLPGSHIPIISPQSLLDLSPDKVIVLPWNLVEEVKTQLLVNSLYTVIPTLRSH